MPLRRDVIERAGSTEGRYGRAGVQEILDRYVLRSL